MQLTDILAQTGGLRSISSELGVSESETAVGAAALLPLILGGFKKQAQADTSGPEGLEGMLDRLGGGTLLDNVLSPEPTDVSRGNNVLGQIFGSKEVSRAAAQDASIKSGLSPELLKRMLPLLAMAVAGYMAKQRQGAAPSSTGGGFGDLLGSLTGGQRAAPGTPTRTGGLGSLIDRNGDGNPLDDILRMAGKFIR
jgi:hypothetical protein